MEPWGNMLTNDILKPMALYRWGKAKPIKYAHCNSQWIDAMKLSLFLSIILLVLGKCHDHPDGYGESFTALESNP